MLAECMVKWIDRGEKSLNVGDGLFLPCTLHFSVTVSHTSGRCNQALAPGTVPVAHARLGCVMLGQGRILVPFVSFQIENNDLFMSTSR